jgi:hypothetical protein
MGSALQARPMLTANAAAEWLQNWRTPIALQLHLLMPLDAN